MPPGQVRGTLTIGVILSIFRNELAIGILSAHVVPHDQDVVTVPLVDGPGGSSIWLGTSSTQAPPPEPSWMQSCTIMWMLLLHPRMRQQCE
ncbi:hypothetical protein CMUST_05740 [Corynebacterium mustelae]|uniref:Uncharacterized protein n=2 Tax=Corynebacterium mustelae TaxID=571915 RepID=A0A0G3GWE1_9CORY|nr:hypothetical protein CMUST_05740 [Corynebacterium mustelae]